MLTPIVDEAFLFLFSLLSLVLPALILALRNVEYRRNLFLYIPVSIAIQVLSVAVLASIFFRVINFGWSKYVIVLTASSLLTGLLLRWLHAHRVLVIRSVFNGRALFVISILALVVVIDNFLILGKQGLFGVEMPYFRPGLISDPVRNTIIINALIREDGSPFLPGSVFSYQLLWHQFAALFVAPFANHRNFHLVGGITILTGYLLFFMLLWAVAVMRPGLILRYKFVVFVFIAAMIASHADYYNYFFRTCIEADGSCGETEYRNFSVKLATLSSPQHAFFLVVLVFFYATSRLLRHKPQTVRYHRVTAFIVMFLISPVMTALFLPCHYAYEYLTLAKRREWPKFLTLGYEIVALLMVAISLYWVIARTSPLDLFARPSIGSLDIFPFDKDFLGSVKHLLRSLIHTPRTVVWGFGILGLAAVLLIFARIYRRTRGGQISFESYYYAFIILGMTYLFNFMVVHGEIRRHVVILLSPVIVLMILKLLPSWKKLSRSVTYLATASLAFVVSGYLHGIYIYSYVAKPSVVSAGIDWSDYACMNEKIYKHYANTPTLAAVAAGLVFPPVMEVAPSFAGPEHTYVHSKVPSAKMAILRQIEDGATPLEFVSELGFENIIWGPLEDIRWGREAKKPIVGNAIALETCGEVTLYSIR